MFKKKGFTLLELIIVVIIISVLAGLAIPQYLKAVEKAKAAKARQVLSELMQAEKLYHIDALTFTTSVALLDTVYTGIVGAISSDQDWTYIVANADGSTFDLAATREGGGAEAGRTILLNQSATFGGNHTMATGSGI